MPSDVAVVIVTYNSAEHITQAVASVCDNGVTDIVVVDNASTDDTQTKLAALPVTVLTNQKNQGFAKACNQGWARTTAPFILFLNPDTLIHPQALAKAMAIIIKDPKIGVLGLQLVTETGQPESFSWGEPMTVWSFWTRRLFTKQLPVAGGLHQCGWVSGGAMIVRRSAWQQVKGFDPGFFMYWEDIDLCRRLNSAGWTIYHLADARVTHIRGASLDNQAAKTRLYDQSADRYWRKHYATPIWIGQRLARWVYRFWSPSVA